MNTQSKNDKPVFMSTMLKKLPNKFYLIAALFMIILGVWVLTGFLRGLRDSGQYDIPVHEVERDNLRVTVTAGGTLQALRSHEVQSKVEGSTQILSIIPEGTIITEEDVENGTVLMELDASDARERLDQQEITVQDASASYTQAKEDYTIQQEQNESDISQAELKVRFSLMELKRYLGDELAQKAVDGELDFEDADWHEHIGGASLQDRRNLENAVSLANEELSRTRESLHWTRELVDRGYVNRNELVADELQEKRRIVELERAEAELDLFLRYSLVKNAEEKLADYIEAKRNLERTKARARGRIAQAQANRRSRESTYNLQKDRLERLKLMIDYSRVEATRPGLVVYASTTNPRQFRNSPVQEGLSVREGQTILSIPDLSTLAARVEVPETQAQMVRAGLPATISLDAMPDDSWQGEVRRISPMATQQWGFRALTGGGSGYETDVAFTGLNANNTELKPGMSATVEIEIVNIQDTLSVPIHAVHTRDGRRVCWVQGPDEPQLNEVELGFYTDTHVQIRRGLQEGDRVLLTQPARIPRNVRLMTLPEREPAEDEEEYILQQISDSDSENTEHDPVGDEIQEILDNLPTEIRERIMERMRDPEMRERLTERLKDPETRRQILERMQDSQNGERQRDGRGRRQ